MAYQSNEATGGPSFVALMNCALDITPSLSVPDGVTARTRCLYVQGAPRIQAFVQRTGGTARDVTLTVKRRTSVRVADAAAFFPVAPSVTMLAATTEQLIDLPGVSAGDVALFIVDSGGPDTMTFRVWFSASAS